MTVSTTSVVAALATLAIGCGAVASGPTDAGGRDASRDAGCDSGRTTVACAAEVDPRFLNGAIAVDDVNVYWVALGQNVGQSVVLQARRAGGQPTTLASGNPSALATDGQFVYWGGGSTSGIFRAPVNGGGVATLTMATSTLGVSPACLVVDDTAVYWNDGANLGRLLSVPKTGGTATVMPGSPPSVDTLTQDATNVYWGGPGAGRLGKADHARTDFVGVDGGAGLYFKGCRGLAVGGERLFAAYSDFNGNDTLASLPLDGGPPTLLASGGAYGVLVGASLYTVGFDPALSVRATPFDGGPSVTLATPATNAIHDIALASDGTLYWTTDTQVQSIKP